MHVAGDTVADQLPWFGALHQHTTGRKILFRDESRRNISDHYLPPVLSSNGTNTRRSKSIYLQVEVVGGRI
jgi:hypothetical protein